MKHTQPDTSDIQLTGYSASDHRSSTENAVSLSDILGPAISRTEALTRIQEDPTAFQTFCGFPMEEQEKILGFIQGNHGLPILYDSFFKKIMNPEANPERLEQFLSVILREPVHIRSVLPVEGTKLVDAGSLVIMDIVVELNDGALIDLEIQKIGYAFPGERSSCYLADFIMRQYNRARSSRKQAFSFRDLKPVWLIVLMENSSPEFRSVAPHYIHRRKEYFDSGVHVKTLGNLIYISLDTFRSVVQNIDMELDAWLTFLSSDQPADIVQLVRSYPQFGEYYQDIIDFRRHPKELIGMFSEALTIMDRNTALYMCEEWKKEAEELKEQIQSVIAEKDSVIAEKDSVISERDSHIAALLEEVRQLKQQV